MDPNLPKFDPNLPLFRVLIRLAHGVGLPVEVVKNIRDEFILWWHHTATLIGNRRLEWDGFGGVNPWIYKRWSGTHRMVNFNRMWGPGKWKNRPSWIELLQSLTGP